MGLLPSCFFLLVYSIQGWLSSFPTLKRRLEGDRVGGGGQHGGQHGQGQRRVQRAHLHRTSNRGPSRTNTKVTFSREWPVTFKLPGIFQRYSFSGRLFTQRSSFNFHRFVHSTKLSFCCYAFKTCFARRVLALPSATTEITSRTGQVLTLKWMNEWMTNQFYLTSLPSLSV